MALGIKPGVKPNVTYYAEQKVHDTLAGECQGTALAVPYGSKNKAALAAEAKVVSERQNSPQGLKPLAGRGAMARLKPCPDEIGSCPLLARVSSSCCSE